ncbi:hypothetical protein HDA41_004444 [Streptomyces caelestis]|uniref:Uncharacterized protein n=1 Tax=Streptomyces caelestis TaxID=36816 RepID=A0A7W9LU99_9ACTN|nr:hypothetical protein [Streptomyces caelestis]
MTGANSQVAKPLRRQWAAFSVGVPPRTKFSSTMASSTLVRVSSRTRSG